MSAGSDLLFGLLVLEGGLIDPGRLADACAVLRAQDLALGDVLIARGWIRPDDRVRIDALVLQKTQAFGREASSISPPRRDQFPGELVGSQPTCEFPEPAHTTAEETEPNPDSPSLGAEVRLFGSPRYTRIRLHAAGGIGCIWLARDNYLGREIALKELRPDQACNPLSRSRFLKEAQITGQLEHPGIVPVYELASQRNEQQPFYTMRFINGQTLTAAARAFHAKRLAGQFDSLQWSILLNALVTVCNTVAYAHSRGVLHRDLKGQNVVLGDFGEVAVLDWGLAKLVGHAGVELPEPSVPLEVPQSGEALTVEGQVCGTPGYMAPEQAAGRHGQIDQRTDVYGLGAILYEILTGQPPFTGPETRELLRRVCEERPTPPTLIWAEVPSTLEEICLRARQAPREPVRHAQCPRTRGAAMAGGAAEARRRCVAGIRVVVPFARRNHPYERLAKGRDRPVYVRQRGLLQDHKAVARRAGRQDGLRHFSGRICGEIPS